MNFFYAIIIGLKMKAYHFNTDILYVGHKAQLKLRNRGFAATEDECLLRRLAL